MSQEALFLFYFLYNTQFSEVEIAFIVYVIFSSVAIIHAEWKARGLRFQFQALEDRLITQKEVKLREAYRFEEMGRMSAGLVHDLANPITALMISLDELEAKHGVESVRQVREGVNYIEECLDSARANLKNQNRKQFFCARSEIMRVIGFLQPKATARGVGITARLSEAELYGENSKFGQVVSNLLDNAIDAYDRIGRHPNKQVVVCLGQANNGSITLSVKDAGIGIPKKEFQRIFQPFFSTKPGKGTGLGLSIVRRIVEDDFGGNLNLNSSSGAGTIFVVELPLPQKLTRSNDS